jgi:hypothetical protein
MNRNGRKKSADDERSGNDKNGPSKTCGQDASEETDRHGKHDIPDKNIRHVASMAEERLNLD